MDKYEELLKKFFKETDFLGHSTGYEARTVLEFAQWLDNQSAQQSVQRTDLETCEKCARVVRVVSGMRQESNR